MTDSPAKPFGQSSQNFRPKSKKDDHESGLKDATNKLNSSLPIGDKNEQKEMGNTAKSSGGFKNFFGAFRKHKPEAESATKMKNELHEVDTKFKESGYLMTKKGKPTNKSKLINKRNITSGRIHLNRLDQGDVFDDTSDIPTRESMYELLDQVPSKTSSHLENRKTGKFSWISKRAIKNLMDTKAKIQKPLHGDHMEDDLINFINDMTDFYHKLFFFFQGLLPGLSLMHIFLIYMGTNENSLLSSYAAEALRINQLFHIISLLAVFGGVYRAMHAKLLYDQSMRYQSESLMKDRKSYFKTTIATICFLVVYAIVIYTNEFASSISKVSNTISTMIGNYTSNFSIWKVLNIIQLIFALLGWLIIVTEAEMERTAKTFDEWDEEEENQKEEA